MRLPYALLSALMVLLGLALPAAASAASPPTTPELLDAAEQRGDISSDRADLYLAYAFGDPARLPAEYRSNSPWDGTLPLLHLQRDVRKMPRGRARGSIEDEISAQHTGATCSSSTANLPNSVDTARFHIDYNTIGGGLTIAEYQTSLETTWGTEVTSYGWAAPPVLTANPPPGNRYHVRIDTLAGGLYGFISSSGSHAGTVGNNPNTAWSDGDALASCMVLNRDFSPFPGTSQQALAATAAHEFNHSIQYGYGAAQGANVPDDVFFEGGATWMEDEVFDTANDNYNYLWPDFEDSLGEYDGSPYEYWITFRGLTERFGTNAAEGGEDVMQRFWEATSQNVGNLTAMNSALTPEGITLAEAFHDYAIAVKYNRGCIGGYVPPYCFEEGPAYVTAVGAAPMTATIGAVGGTATRTIEDNYAINWIALPTSAAGYRVTLQNTSQGGALRGTAVCDTGTDLALFALPGIVGPSGSQAIEGFSTAGCTNPVLVITNESQTAANPATSLARAYSVTTGSSSTRSLSVTKAGSGTGTVASTPAGINCGLDCAENYSDGATVTLTATPSSGMQFSGWTGDCSGSGVCVVTMDAARGVTAQFIPVPAANGTGGGTDGPVLPTPDLAAPSLTNVRLSARRFRAARSGASIASPLGTRVTFTLSEVGRVAFRVERSASGRRVAGRCRATHRRNRNKPRCIRWLRVPGGFGVPAAPGSNRFRFRGRVAGRRLRPGRYRLIAVPADSAGNRAPAARFGFRVVRR